MKLNALFLTAVLAAAVFAIPAHALDYTVEGPESGAFGTPTSDETVYVGTENTANVDRSKNTALIPPGFSGNTSSLPGGGEPLAPNLTVGGGSVTAPYPGTGGAVELPSTSVPPAYTAVTSYLYYSGGHLGTLSIPALGLSVKVYQGTDSAQLAKGAGHFPGTSIWDGNVAVAAHNRGVTSHFGQIHTLDLGDRITLTTRYGTRAYAVTGVFKVSETDMSMLEGTSENCISLFTCVKDQPAFRWCVRGMEI